MRNHCCGRRSLKRVGRGRFCRVVSNECREIAKKRFMEMGLIEGTKIQVVRVAPLGDPIEIKVRNYNLILRKNECDKIYVEEDDEN